MNRLFARSIVTGIAALLASSAARADLTAKVVLSDSHGSGPGGEFRVNYTNLGLVPSSLGESATQFEAFCVEKNEFIGFGRTYYAQPNTATVRGGYSGGSPDPLSVKTAFLYNAFIHRTLAAFGYSYATSNGNPARRQSANALQNVIWYLEDEMQGHSYTYGLTTSEAVLATSFYNAAMASNWSNIGAVRVLNLYEDAQATRHAQDQLVELPTLVPAPGAVLLGTIGLAMVGRLRRRFGV